MDNKELARLRWACRRGMLELDLILQPYLDAYYLNASEYERQSFNKLLDCNDQELYDWLVKREQPKDADLQYMVSVLLTDAQL